MAKGLGKGINALFTNLEVGKEDAVIEVDKGITPKSLSATKSIPERETCRINTIH